MARKKPEEEQCGNWMDTYGDMVTLLLTFFVMLFSMSSVNEEKFAILVKAFTSKDPETINLILDQTGKEEGMEHPENRTDTPPQGDNPAEATLEELQDMIPQDFDDLYEYLKSYVQKADLQDSVEVVDAGEGCVFIRFQDNIFFTPNSASLRATSAPLLDFLGNCLKGVEEQIMTVNINGHTADPKGYTQDISDWKLSGERASNVATYFETRNEFDPKKLLPIGYGKNYPIASNDTSEGMQKNRRVDMVIISNNTELTDKEILNSILLGTFDPTQYPAEGGTRDVLVPSGITSSAAASSSSVASQPSASSTASTSSTPPASSSSGFVVQPSGQEGQASLAPARPSSTAASTAGATGSSAGASDSIPEPSPGTEEGIPQGAQVVSPYGG